MGKITQIDITIRIKDDNAKAKISMRDKDGKEVHKATSLTWLAIARILSRYESETLENAAVCVSEDDKKLAELLKGGDK